MSPPSGRSLQRLVTGPTLVSHVLWLDHVPSTNAEVAERARADAPEGLLVLADRQTAGRGRLGRSWFAPPGTSLLCSLLLRPDVDADAVSLLPLVAGLALAEASEPLTSGTQLALKWPNDLLADGRKCAGVLVELPAPGTVVLGMGVNVDWRGVDRPPELAGGTSLTEAGRRPVDRWRLLGAVVDRLDRRYRAWRDDPHGFLPAYRERCATLDQHVRVTQVDGSEVRGEATRVTDDGALQVEAADGTVVTVRAGDVHHVRPA